VFVIVQALMASTEAKPDVAETPLVDHEGPYRDRVFARTGHYFIIGTMCGLVGGAFTVFATLYYHMNGFGSDVDWSLNVRGEPFPSGNHYMPASISFSVADTSSAGGKVFLAFMVAYAMMTLASLYPFEYANVFVHEDVSLFPCWAPRTCWPSMNTWRAYVPPLGMLLVAFDHASTVNLYNSAQTAASIFHTGGAVAWLAVPLYIEIYTLEWAKDVKIGRLEKELRTSCVILAVSCAILYGFFGNTSPESFGVCCGDVWRYVTQEDVDMANMNGAYAVVQVDLKLMQYAKFQNFPPPTNQGLYDTASGMGLAWKYVGFLGEAGAGFFFLLNGLVIWYFSSPLSAEANTSMHVANQVAE